MGDPVTVRLDCSYTVSLPKEVWRGLRAALVSFRALERAGLPKESLLPISCMAVWGAGKSIREGDQESPTPSRASVLVSTVHCISGSHSSLSFYSLICGSN